MKHAYFKPEWFTLNFDARAPSNVYFKPQMFTLTPVTVQSLTIFVILDLQENIYDKIMNTYYMSAGEADM